MSSLLPTVALLLFTRRCAGIHSTTMTFDTDSTPISTCPNGMIHPPTLPFPSDMNDAATVEWLEYQQRCFYDGFLNNVLHIDAGTLLGNMITDDTLFWAAKPDGAENCVKMKDNLVNWDLVRNVMDVSELEYNIIELNGNVLRVNGSHDCRLQAAISGFLIGYEFSDGFDETWVFNDDGTWQKFIFRDDRYIGNNLQEWAKSTLSSAFATGDKPILELIERYGHHLMVDHSQKEKYWKLDLRDTSTKMVIGFLLLWFLCAPIGVVYVAMRCCANNKVHKYANVDCESTDVGSEAEELRL